MVKKKAGRRIYRTVLPLPKLRHAIASLLLLTVHCWQLVYREEQKPCHSRFSLLLSLPEALLQNILLQLSSFTLRFLSMTCAQMDTLGLSQKLKASPI